MYSIQFIWENAKGEVRGRVERAALHASSKVVQVRGKTPAQVVRDRNRGGPRRHERMAG